MYDLIVARVLEEVDSLFECFPLSSEHYEQDGELTANHGVIL